ncbi:regulator of (H+)-ATPase in vacuolar membrane [Dipsacomyces acuminosporus]|nr:regulator of (H+)-ATPase in vacuolar membrane [Dipsacomyces acuminosporus]
MALRSIYTGRANHRTLTSACVGGSIYIAYASGQEVVIHDAATNYVQSVTHAGAAKAISALVASESGRLAAISGSAIVVFSPVPAAGDKNAAARGKTTDTSRAKVQWSYSSHFGFGGDECAKELLVCEWLGEDRMLVGSEGKLSLWTCADSAWTKSWTRTAGGTINAVAAAPDASLFATASQNSRMVKIWYPGFSDCHLRFQYVVHSAAVLEIFWRRHVSDTHAVAKDRPALYTVTRDGRFNVWSSTVAANGCPKFVLVSAIDIARSSTANGLSATQSQRQLVAARVLEVEPTTSNEESGSATNNSAGAASASGLQSNSGAATDAANSDPSNRPSREAMENKMGSTASRSPSSVFEHVYAVYDDGSMDIWEIKNRAGVFDILSAERLLKTVATKAQFPMAPSISSWDPLVPSLLWQSRSNALRLAMLDTVGHVYLFSAPDPRTGELSSLELCLDSLWDGHKEPIFHISVDPYSHRVATHSVEGELLIWDTIPASDSALSISRRMGLDGSQIRTIAWAPTESEFICATNEKIYRLVYDGESEQWSPCNTSLPQMGTYDHIFTYPEANFETTLDAKPDISTPKAYYISTIEKSSRVVRTWRVAGPKQSIEFVDKSVLNHATHFDRASRVMPVAYPFFSRDNIMVTFDTNSGHMRIWGIRTSPRFMWFCSKKHCLPRMDVRMIRYNSIDKAAIVSAASDGSQVITVWVFSSASRTSHYLPAGTIYPRKKTDQVREIRWFLTDCAQSYLGIQWDDRVDIYCQERNLDNAWLCIFTIHASEFGPGVDIGSFSFTAAGEPTFSVGRKLVVYSQNLPGGKRISDAAFEEHGELPLIHPFVLTELMSWGQMDAVKQLLARLYDYIRERDIDSTREVALPTIPLDELIALDSSSSLSSGQAGRKTASSGQKSSGIMSKYSSLFGSELDSDDNATHDSSAPDFDGFSNDKASYIIEKLTEIKIHGISPVDQARLMSIVSTISVSLIKDQPIDSMGVRYLLKLQLLELENKRTRSASELTYRELNWAMHSNSQAILLQLCLQQYAPAGLTWDAARRMGIFTWLSDISVLKSEMEKMARNIFVAEGRDPTRCAIFYLALKKQRLLLGLWRIAHSHPEQSKMLAFLSHDFSEARWKTAAAKNAYVLLSRQRYLDAATFFMLSGKLADAATVCIAQLKDIQMAIAICRCHEGDGGPVLKAILWKHVLPDAFSRQDRWLASLAFGIVHKYDLVLQALTDDLSRLATQLSIEMEAPSSSPMEVLDTELLILYRNMLSHSPYYRAPLVIQAGLIAQTITIFECLGVPVMSLVVLEWWRRELYDATTKAAPLPRSAAQSTTSLSFAPPSGVAATHSSIDSGLLDMSAFGGFSTFGASKHNPAPKPAVPAVDPMASGMLSMDSFGSTFAGMSLSSTSRSPAKEATPGTAVSARNSGQDSPSNSATGDDCDDSALALTVEIEDTPVQYACRVTLALQIFEYVNRASKQGNGGAGAIDVEREKKTIASTLRLPAVKVPAARHVARTTALRFETTAAGPATKAATEGAQSPAKPFTTAPKPAKKKGHKLRNTAILTLLAGTGFVGAAAYAQEDLEFGQQFEHYVPGARRFMQLIRHHDDSLVMALSDVGFNVYHELAYTGRFIYGQFFGLVNMLQHNSWHGAGDDKKETGSSGWNRDVAAPPSSSSSVTKPGADATAGKSKSSSFPTTPIESIQVAVEIPALESDNASIVALSKALSAVVTALNKKGLSPENVQQFKVLNDSLVVLDNHLNNLKEDEKRTVEAALDEERKKFEASLADFQKAARIALAAREAQLIEANDNKLMEAAAAADERVASELAAQRDLLERRFNRFVRARVDEERGGRLAHLDRVEAQLRQLTQMAQESGDLIRQSQAVSRLSVALAALKSAVAGSKAQTPFASELSAVASAATTDFPATKAAIQSVSRETAEQGIPSQIELEDRFEAVRKEIRSVSLVPENGNFGSQVLSATLSKVMFEKEGLVEGEDVEAILSRTGHYLKQHNLDLATRELNQLHGWPKKLAEDWITSARRRLEIEQAIAVAESEELLAKLAFI